MVLRRKNNVIKIIMEIGIITLNSVNRNLGGYVSSIKTSVL